MQIAQWKLSTEHLKVCTERCTVFRILAYWVALLNLHCMVNLSRRQRSETRNRNISTVWYLHHWNWKPPMLTNSSCHLWPHKHKPSSTLDFWLANTGKEWIYRNYKMRNKLGGRTSQDQRGITICTATHDQSWTPSSGVAVFPNPLVPQPIHNCLPLPGDAQPGQVWPGVTVFHTK